MLMTSILMRADVFIPHAGFNSVNEALYFGVPMAGMIEIVSREKNKRKIKYGITKKGKQELEAWLLEETIQQPMRSEFLLKLLFSSSQPMEVDTIARVHKYYLNF